MLASGNYSVVNLSVQEDDLSEVLEALRGIISNAKIKRVRQNIVVSEETVNIDRYLKENL